MVETAKLPSLVGGVRAQIDLPSSDPRVSLEFVTSVAVTALAALECLDIAVVLVGTELAILHVNRAAAAILQSGDGFRVAGSSLACIRVADTAKLRRLVECTINLRSHGRGETVNVGRNSGRRPYSVSASQVAAPATGPTHRYLTAIVYINDPEIARAASCAEMARLYGLTAAEARIAEALLDHDRLADVAATLGVSLATVRTLLQRAFEKTDTHRQADLVRLMLAHRVPAAPNGAAARD